MFILCGINLTASRIVQTFVIFDIPGKPFMAQRSSFLIFCLLSISCGKKESADQLPSTLTVEEIVSNAGSVIQDSSNNRPQPDVIATSVADRPGIRILPTGTFHADEVEEGVDALPWLGLFTGDDGNFLLKEIQIVATRVFDGLLDDEDNGEMTGWEVNTVSGEYPTILISGGELTEGKIEAAETPATLYPGDSLQFLFNDVHYLLYATGSREIDSLYGANLVADYNLYIVQTHNGKRRTSLLVSHANFDEAMTSILWSGDLDRDGYIDFLIDMSRHYNKSLPTLFLSKPATAEEVVVPVAEHSSVGC